MGEGNGDIYGGDSFEKIREMCESIGKAIGEYGVVGTFFFEGPTNELYAHLIFKRQGGGGDYHRLRMRPNLSDRSPEEKVKFQAEFAEYELALMKDFSKLLREFLSEFE